MKKKPRSPKFKKKVMRPTQSAAADERALILPISAITVPRNPREKLENIEELAASIKASGGLLQPLVVTKAKEGWELIAGARRLAALHLLGAKDAPVRVLSVASEAADVLRLVENLQRDGLSGWDTCRAIHALLPQFQSQRKLAEAIGKTESYVSKCMAVVNSKPELERVQGLSLRDLFASIGKQEGPRSSSGVIAGGRYVNGAIQLRNSGPNGRFSLRINFDPEKTPADTKIRILETLKELLRKLELP